MSTWFFVIVNVTRMEAIPNSALTNAVYTFPEGGFNDEKPSHRWLRIAFFGDKLLGGKKLHYLRKC